MTNRWSEIEIPNHQAEEARATSEERREFKEGGVERIKQFGLSFRSAAAVEASAAIHRFFFLRIIICFFLRILRTFPWHAPHFV